MLISILTFATYAALGHSLTAAKVCAYSSVALLGLVHVVSNLVYTMHVPHTVCVPEMDYACRIFFT